MASTRVALVLDPDYGERLRELATQMAVRIIDSPTNKAVARELWERNPNAEHMITTFKEPSVRAETCSEGLMENIELHHGHHSQTPALRELEVVGLKLTPTVQKVLTDFGFAFKERTIAAFLLNGHAKSKLERLY
jgi:hypothetical protein